MLWKTQRDRSFWFVGARAIVPVVARDDGKKCGVDMQDLFSGEWAVKA